MTPAAPNNNVAASASTSLFQPRWRTLLAAALAGLLLGSIWWFAQPNPYRATATVLVNPLAAKQLGPGSEVIPVRTIENERLFADSSVVRAPIQVQMPEAVDAMTITIDDKADALWFTARADDPQVAERIATIWSTTFVTERRKALVNSWTLSAEAIQRELDSLRDDIVASSDQGDDAAVGDLSVRRDAVALALPEINQQLSLLRGSTAAEFLGPVAPAARSREAGFAGRALRGTLLGLLVGAVLAAALGGPILPPKRPAKKRAVRPPEPAEPAETRAPTPALAAPPAAEQAVAAVEPTPAPVTASAPTPTAATAESTGQGLALPSYLRDALAPEKQPEAPAAPPEQPSPSVAPTPSPAPTPTATPTPPPAPVEPTPVAPAKAAAPVATEKPRVAPVPDVAPRPTKPRLRRVKLDPLDTVE